MNIAEPIEEINKRLLDYYGKKEDKPAFRVVWSEDILEKRLFNVTTEGLQLLTPEIREVPKYRHYIKNQYILEQLTEIPPTVETDLTTNLSYEPLWVFADKDGFPLPPQWKICKIIIDTVKDNIRKAISPQKGGLREDNTVDGMREKEKLLSEALFGLS